MKCFEIAQMVFKDVSLTKIDKIVAKGEQIM